MARRKKTLPSIFCLRVHFLFCARRRFPTDTRKNLAQPLQTQLQV